MIPLQASERDFQRAVIDLAKLRGWRVSHALPARTRNGWATATQGHVGAPDLLLARDGIVYLAELKTLRGKPTPEQQAWLSALGFHGRLWTPTHMRSGEIQEVLR